MKKKPNIIHKDTCALIQVKEIDYQTKVIEHEQTKMVLERPFDIIKKSCTHYWIMKEDEMLLYKNYVSKNPLPLSIRHKLCFLPFHSPFYIDNCWVNFDQIKRWVEVTKKKRSSREQIEVIFKNEEEIVFDVSAYTFSSQFTRTLR